MSKIIKQYTINNSYYDKDTKKFNEKEIDIVKEGCEEKLNDLFYDMENAVLFYSLGSKKNILPYIFKKEIYPDEGRIKISAELNSNKKEGQEEIFSFNIYYCGLDEKEREIYTIFEDWIYSVNDKLNHVPYTCSNKYAFIADLLFKMEKKTQEYIDNDLLGLDEKGMLTSHWIGN